MTFSYMNRGAINAVEAPEDEGTLISLANNVVAIPRALNLSYALLSAFTYNLNLATSLRLSHIEYLFERLFSQPRLPDRHNRHNQCNSYNPCN